MCPHKPFSSSVASASGRRRPSRFGLADLPQKNAEVLSGQYGVNVLLIGGALMLATANDGPAVREEHVLAFLSALMALQLAWMMWYILVRDRHVGARTDKDKHATTGWVRGGLTLLALLSLIMDAFRVGYFVGYRGCVSAVLGAYPVIHATHTIAQVHFLWFHIKDVIKSFQTFERFGVIHAVFTNLLLWCSGVMSEAEHFLKNHVKRLSTVAEGNRSDDLSVPPCNCSTGTCSIFANSLYYLYPFNIEYHIFVSAMLFVMWKNIGRTVEPQSDGQRPRPESHSLSAGPALGLLGVASTIAVLVVYLTHVEQSEETRQAAVSMFYIYGIVMLLSMCGAAAAGLLIYRARHCPFDTSKNPARQLDTQLLFGSSVGAWLMSWCSVVAVVSGGSEAPHRWTNGVYALLLVLEKYIQNLFIIESLYRREPPATPELPAAPELPVAPDLPAIPKVFSVTSTYSGIINCAYDAQERSLEDVEEAAGVYGRKPSQVPLPVGTTLPSAPGHRRKVLKNIALFLTMSNICLWILPAFGCRPQYDNGLEEQVFGFSVWTTVLNFAVPLNLFYRMHAVASLFEVFHRA